MAMHNGWKVLREGQQPGLVLALDFAITGRADSSFSDLTPRMNTPFTVWEARQPADETDMAGADYLDWWTAEVAASGQQVRAVLGYCAGSVFAGALAARIADLQATPPALVVFDPEVPTLASLYRDFSAMMGQFGSVLSADEVAAARTEGSAAGVGVSDFPAYGASLVRIFAEHAGAAFARYELENALRDEFVAVFRSFVSYLDVVRQLAPTTEWANATTVNSRIPTALAAKAGRAVDIQVDHVDLLRSNVTATAVSEIVATLAAPAATA